MSEGRERSEWNRTATLLVKLHNVHASKKSELIKFENVHPFLIIDGIERGPTEDQLSKLKKEIESFNG